MGLFDMVKEKVVVFEGNMYAVAPVNIDVSKTFDKPKGTDVITHKITGFDYGKPVCMIINTEEEGFYFAVELKKNEYEILDHEETYNLASRLVINLNENM